jgi:hypothetical protein
MSLMHQLARSTFDVEENVRANNRKTSTNFNRFIGVLQPSFDVRGAMVYRNVGITICVLDFIVFFLWLALMFMSLLDKKTGMLTDIQLLGVHHLVLTLGIVHLCQTLDVSMADQKRCAVPAASVSSVLFGIMCAFFDLVGVTKTFYLPRNYTMLFRIVVCSQLATSFIVILWSGAAYAWQSTANMTCSAKRVASATATNDSDGE